MNVVIDKRPIWVILLSRSLRPLFFVVVAIIFWYLVSIPTPDGLGLEGQRTIALFVVCLILWVSGVLPLAITSLLAIVMVPLLGVLDKKAAYALFGNEAVFFILGAFILSGAVMHSGLAGRTAVVIMSRFGETPKRLIASIFFLAAVLSFFMSEHAVAAMFFPIVLEIAKGLNLKPGKSVYAKSLFLALAWGCIIGGVATFLGGARVPLAVGMLKEATGINIGFFEYTAAAFPTVLIMLLIGYFMLTKFLPSDVEDIHKIKAVFERKIKELGKIGYAEYAVGVLMAVTIFLWLFLGRTIGIANIAIASVVVLFVFKLVRWKDIEEYVNWGIILMYGGAITLGAAMEKSGAAAWIANTVISEWARSPLIIIAILSLLTILLTEGMSNAAVIAILLPVGIGIAGKFNLDPRIITYTIAIPAGLAFCFPMSTPANAIAVSSGYVTARDMAKAGVLMMISAWVLFNITVFIYWPLIGIKI
ncbi:MAG: anion transporter [Deltaproteobacteria bacterium GWC2_42_11]|nr:MAG: anion transporter [Deltaproteobacteria bacterium GWC2_42_11]HBO84607.1 anion transporter [Deltaproteobacteria bacterium]